MRNVLFSKETRRWLDLDVTFKILRREIGLAELHLISQIFNPDWYIAQHPDVAKAGVNPLVHYLNTGAAKGYDPVPLFDTDWYVAQHTGNEAERINPLTHYLTTGAPEGRNPHPLFDAEWYRSRYPDTARTGLTPLTHYLTAGWRKGCSPNPLFDTAWYLAQYPDVAAAGVEPFAHYLAAGGQEGRDPNPLFDSDWYLEKYPDVARAGLNPLAHYLMKGAAAGYDPNPRFDSDWYLKNYSDVVHARRNPLAHYIAEGAAAKLHTTLFAKRRHAALAIVADSVTPLLEIEPQLRASFRSEGLTQMLVVPGQTQGPKYEAWNKLFASLSRTPDRMIFVPTLADGAVATALLTQTNNDPTSQILLVASDNAGTAVSTALPNNMTVRALSDIDPDLTPQDRAEIVRALIYFSRPRTVINANSLACWTAISTSGAALSTNTELRVLVEYRNDDAEANSHRDLYFASCYQHLSKIYFTDTASRDQLVSEYGLPLASKVDYIVLDRQSSH